MEKRNPNRLIMVLILVILLLLGVVLYILWLGPAINGYVINKQIEARDIVLSTIISQVQQQGYTTITDQQGNTLVLVPAQPQGATV